MKPEDLNPVRKVLSSLQRSVKSKSEKLFGPFKYSLRGRNFCCSHCGGEQFYKSRGQAKTRFASLFNLDWLDPQMTMLICSECGLVFWLAHAPDRRD